MNRLLNGAALAAGLAAALWVAFTHAGSHPAVLPMLALIMVAFFTGAAELRRYRAQTQDLLGALAQANSQPPEQLEVWLGTLPSALRGPVRLRMKGLGAALPGPSLAPMLTGLLVLLGLLGTFIGMVSTLGGTVSALNASADLQAVRVALAAPVQGLGLAFGTSVAGVAASASLGLMSALARRERARASRELDAMVATVLHPFTEDHRQGLMLKALQSSAEQGHFLPEVAQRMESALAQLVQGITSALSQNAQRTESTLAHSAQRIEASLGQVAADSRASSQAVTQAQSRFHEQAARDVAHWNQLLNDRFSQTAQALTQSQREAAAQSARETRALVEPLLEKTLAGLVQRLTQTTSEMQDRLSGQADAVQAALQASTERVNAQLLEGHERVQAQIIATTEQSHSALREQFLQLTSQTFSELLAREVGQLAERERLLKAVDTLMQALQHAATGQRQALDGLLASAAQTLTQSAQRFDAQAAEVAATLTIATERSTTSLSAATEQAAASLAAATSQAAESLAMATERTSSSLISATEQAAASSDALTQVGDQFAQALQGFAQVNQALGDQLGRVEAALGQHLARSDEQLAYYVAQAREVIELTLGAQAQLLEDLRQVTRQAA